MDSAPGLQSHIELSEERLRQGQKMEAIGQLAGGLVHDFNNLLGVILGYCDLLEEQTGLPEPARKLIQEIHHAANSGKNLTRQLLAFSRRPQGLAPVALDLNAIVRRTKTMLERLLGAEISLTSELCPDLRTIRADPTQLEQVLLNLALNARDAMPAGGEISIATANVDLDQAHALASHLSGPGPYVRLIMSDTGVGMDAEVQSHIFEAFFSTKPPGQGTGLGLSTAAGIVRESGGAITVSSRPGEGTSFQIFFPGCSQAAAVELHSSSPVCGGTETILLVDDAGPLRRLIRRLLQSCGYNVLETGNPGEALRIAAHYPQPLPLMITDVVMPGWSGSLLAEKLAAARPETKVLYVSGYRDEAIVAARMPGQDCAFLEKPFTREHLLRKVRDLLDAPQTT